VAKILFLVLLCGLILSGCYSKCGLTEKYYCNCEEWYDAEGNYHKKCPENGMLDIHIRGDISTP
jgi:hypothetical protein